MGSKKKSLHPYMTTPNVHNLLRIKRCCLDISFQFFFICNKYGNFIHNYFSIIKIHWSWYVNKCSINVWNFWVTYFTCIPFETLSTKKILRWKIIKNMMIKKMSQKATKKQKKFITCSKKVQITYIWWVLYTFGTLKKIPKRQVCNFTSDFTNYIY